MGSNRCLEAVAEKAVFFCLAERSEGLWLSCVCWACSGAAEGMADTPGGTPVSLVSLSDTRWLETSSSLLRGSVFAYIHTQMDVYKK